MSRPPVVVREARQIAADYIQEGKPTLFGKAYIINDSATLEFDEGWLFRLQRAVPLKTGTSLGPAPVVLDRATGAAFYLWTTGATMQDYVRWYRENRKKFVELRSIPEVEQRMIEEGPGSHCYIIELAEDGPSRGLRGQNQNGVIHFFSDKGLREEMTKLNPTSRGFLLLVSRPPFVNSPESMQDIPPPRAKGT